LCIFINCAKDSDKSEIIDINGIKKPLLGHITNAVLNPKKDQFGQTHIIRINSKGNFVLVGNVLSLSEEDLLQIGKDNCVYVPYYTMTKIDGIYKEIGAIIIGTKDKSKGKELHFAAVKKMRNNEL